MTPRHVCRYEDKAIEQNIFISPSSIYHTLMLAYFGALGETQVATFVSAEVKILYIVKNGFESLGVLSNSNLFTKHLS